MSRFYDDSGFDATIDVSASTRKFQQSIIIKQDPNKAGILTFLSESEPSTTTPPPADNNPRIRPQRRQGGY